MEKRKKQPLNEKLEKKQQFIFPDQNRTSKVIKQQLLEHSGLKTLE